MDLQQDPQPHDQDNNMTGTTKSSYVCRQGSTRWAPTSDQVRILKELYYNNGVRSPSAEQIQEISARLRQYGKIEGKNVFYWFQNHKARERQKKRFTVDTAMAMQRHQHGISSTSELEVFSSQESTRSTSSSAGGVLGVGHMGSNVYGSLGMEMSFRDFSISLGGSSNVGDSMKNNFFWVGSGVDPSQYLERSTPLQHVWKNYSQAGIKTLPLFPMHGEDSTGSCSGNLNPHDNWLAAEDGKIGSRTSLELSLTSCNLD